MPKRTVHLHEPLRDGDIITATLRVAGGRLFPVSMSDEYFHADGILGRALRRAGSVTREVPEISFLPGDVMVTDRYTCVRGVSGFLGEGATHRTDARMLALFNAGTARLIARNGVALPTPVTIRNLEDLPA